MFENIKPIIAKFQINGAIHKIIPIEIGHINVTYQILMKEEQKESAYILQKINTNIFKQPIKVMDNIVKVGSYLKRNKYPKKVLFPIQSFDNQYFERDNQNNYWRLYPFIKNTQTINQVEKEEQAYEGAFLFGEYLHYLKSFDAHQLQETIPNFHNTNLCFQQFYNCIKRATDKKKKTAEKSIATLLQFRYLLGPMQQLKLPVRVVHNDTKINNILFDKNSAKAICVIDLDTLMPGTLLADYGDMVRTFTPPRDENNADLGEVFVRKNILTALTAGYLAGLKDAITPLEKTLLPYGAKLIIFEQAIRFLTDYLNGNIYYKVDYETQNLVRARNQIRLLESLTSLVAK